MSDPGYPVGEALYATDGTPVNITQQACDTMNNGKKAMSSVIGVGLAFPIIAIVAVVLRFVTVRILKRMPAIDDWAIVLALIPSVAVCFLVVAAEYAQDRLIKNDLNGVEDPVDRCLYALDDMLILGWPAQYSVAQGAAGTIGLIAAIFHVTAVSFVKISILLFYGKIFTTPSMRMIVRIGSIFMLCYWLAFFIPNAVYIKWTLTLDYSEWLSLSWSILLLVAGVLDLATDLVILCLPAFYIATLQISKAKKLQCIGIFGVGTVVVIASIARLVALIQYWQIALKTAQLGVDSIDWENNQQQAVDFYAAVPLDRAAVVSRDMMLWTFIEPCTAILAACLPTYRPLVEKVSQAVSSWSKSRSYKSTNKDGSDLRPVDVQERRDQTPGRLARMQQIGNTERGRAARRYD